jgi:hypothetical protein
MAMLEMQYSQWLSFQIFIDLQLTAMSTALAVMLELKTAQIVMLLLKSMNMIECTMALFYSSAIDARINTIYDTA